MVFLHHLRHLAQILVGMDLDCVEFESTISWIWPFFSLAADCKMKEKKGRRPRNGDQ